MARPRKQTRRERGSGSIIALGGDHFKLKWSVTQDGVRRQRYQTIRGNFADAKRELRQITDALALPRPIVSPGNPTLYDFAETWYSETIVPRIDSGLRNSIGARAAETYHKLLNLYVTGAQLGAIKLTAVTPQRIADWIAALATTPGKSGTPVGAKTITEAYHVLRKILALAVARGIIAANPCDAIDHNGEKVVQLPERAAKTRGSLSLKQIGYMQDAMAREGKWFAPIVTLLLYTGLRIGEALAVRWTDVALDHGALYVRQTVTETKAGVRIKPGAKSRAGVRAVALPAPAVELLTSLYPATTPGEDDLVFPRMTAFPTLPLSPKRVSRRFSEWIERGHPELKVRGRVPSAHHMRHTFVSQALMAGATPTILADQIGHSEVEMQRQYSDIMLDSKRALALQFETRLRGTKRGA